jgi:LysR family transcriptional regulator, nitrogen assimilation regulatory protein
MDVRQLRYFLGVLETRSLNKASELLRIAQPTLTSQIHNLERELGVKLLHRHARGVTPTEAGERLAQHSDQLLRHLDRMRQDMSDYAAAPSGSVVICAARSIPGAITGEIVERCTKNFPEVRLRILEGGQQMALDGLEVDLALTFKPPGHEVSFKPPGHEVSFVYEPLVQDELVFVCSAKENREENEIDYNHAIQQTLILPSQRHYTRQLLDAIALTAKSKLTISYEVDSLDVTKDLVARGLGKTIMPIACVKEEVKAGKLRTLAIRNRRFQRTLYLMRSSRQGSSTAIDLVGGEVRAVVREFSGNGTFGWHRLPSNQTGLRSSGCVAA